MALVQRSYSRGGAGYVVYILISYIFIWEGNIDNRKEKERIY